MVQLAPYARISRVVSLFTARSGPDMKMRPESESHE